MFISVAIWFAIMTGLFIGFIALNKESYQPNATPNPKFEVVIVSADNRNLVIPWQDLNHQILATEPDETCVEDCLILKDGNFIFHNEGAMWTSESEYKIINGKAQPISYSFYSINEGLSAFIYAFAVYALLKYAFLRVWYRHSAEKVHELNQANLNGLKNWGLFMMLVLGFCIIANFFKTGIVD